ncbi:antirestriction protein ArdA [Eilatimonas milleporae]|uniref:Antirestriction protein ArdA n=1 Tax=Eilatimonas milleporae TaxID=911205 RepID=A0A3M0BV93_9PROT|nr:antirestriction protein ArdA [Eilatimonas milleporae]RMB01494.1 antirestriction protein ArdA [Eilatimonas milleporae]
MTTFYAQPYSLCASGFYFECADTYEAKIGKVRDDYGQPVEEFEIQFIDGETIDAQLFKALCVHQSNVNTFIEKLEEWDDKEKAMLIIAIGECSYDFDIERDDPQNFDVDLYEIDSLKDLAYQFVDDGLFGDIPERFAHYLDYDAIARDLGMDYAEISIDGINYVYRCG